MMEDFISLVGYTVLQVTVNLTDAERAGLAVYFMAATAAAIAFWEVLL